MNISLSSLGDDFLTEYKKEKEKMDDSRNIHSIATEDIKRDIMQVCEWIQGNTEASQLRQVYLKKCASKKKPDLANTTPKLWRLIMEKFPILCKSYPSLVKMAVTDGQSSSFHDDFDVLLECIISAQSGNTSVKDCTFSFENHLKNKYYRKS